MQSSALKDITQRILVIDDSEEEAYLFIREFRKYNTDIFVEVSFTAEDGLKQVRKHEYGLIFCDFRLPGISGLSFLKLSKELQPHTPVVMFTGYDSPELERQAMERGAYAFLLKPVEFETLRRLVTQALACRTNYISQLLPSDETPS